MAKKKPELANTELHSLIFSDNSVDSTGYSPDIVPLPSREITVLGDEKTVDYANENVQKAIDLSMGALENLVGLANQTQNVRTYEAIPKVVDSIVQANKELLEMRERFKTAVKDQVAQTGPKTVHNNLIIDSKGFLESIIDMQKNKMKDIN